MSVLLPSFEMYIFDLDGTLVDSFTDIAKSVNRALEKIDLPNLPEAQLIGYIGRGVNILLGRTMEALGIASEQVEEYVQEAMKYFRPIYAEHMLDHTHLFPGVVETLDVLRGRGSLLTVCSNKPAAFSEKMLAELGVRDRFDAVVGGDSLPTKKPDPEPLLYLMEQFRVLPSQTLMVGDSALDIEAGRRAHTQTCGIAHPHVALERLQQAGADYLLPCFRDLIAPFPVANLE